MAPGSRRGDTIGGTAHKFSSGSFTEGRIAAGTVSPSYLLPIHGLQRLEKIMDEYAGGISTNYMTNGVLLNRGLGVRHPSHAVPQRNALAGVLLPGRSYEAG